MAVIQHRTTKIVGSTDQISWLALGQAAANDSGSEVDAPEHTFKEVQVTGTFDSATVTIQGSLDGGVTWATLNDPQGNALTFTTARLERVQESAARIRPLISSVGASTDLNVYLVIKMDGGATS